MAMALNPGILKLPPIHRAAQKSNATLMVNTKATYQSQSYISDTPPQMQAVYIPTSDDEDCLVPIIVEEHKLY